MTSIILIFEIVATIWILFIIGNYFRSLYWVVISLKNSADIDMTLVNNAKVSLVLGAISSWITAIIIHFGEFGIYGKFSEYPTYFLYILGILLLLISIVSAAFSVAVSWSNNGQKNLFVSSSKSLFGISFTFAIVLWISVWAIS